jgi:hypothetical protein
MPDPQLQIQFRIQEKKMTRQTVFDYKVFRLRDVLIYVAPVQPDAYFADDLGGQSKHDWDNALKEGYRWIRTDGDLVIMERKSQVILGRKFLRD